VKASLFSELKKRRVYRAAAAYGIVAWGVTEILDGVVTGLGWPDWLATLAVILFVTGFPVAMFLAWVYDWTPEGIRRTAPSSPLGWLPGIMAVVFLVAGSGGLFWLINPSGIARVERIGVAVLPCRYRGEAEFAHRGDGIAELVSEQLAHSAELFVPAFGAVVELSARNPETASLAEALGVSWLVECRVGGDARHVSVDASLVDAATDQSDPVVSSEFRSLEIRDTFAAIETALLLRLGVSPGGGIAGRITAQLPSSLDAFDHYLLGRQAMREGADQDLADAIRHFRAAQQHGGFALARLGEAKAMLKVMELVPPASSASRIATLQAIGMMLDELSNEEPVPAGVFAARLRLANLADRFGLDSAAEEALRRQWLESAIGLQPSFAEPYGLFAEYLRHIGRDEEASEYAARGAELAPGLQ
jgi:TolB-like protein